MSRADEHPGLTLIIVRHSQAEDPVRFASTGAPDCDRPLTERGIDRMGRAAKGLRRVLDGVDRIFSSPCERAEHTARILARTFGHDRVEIASPLSPGADPETLADWLSGVCEDGRVVIVGHEPDLSRLVGWLCAGRDLPLVDMKKGAACVLRFDGPPHRGQGRIAWLMNQAQLRKL